MRTLVVVPTYDEAENIRPLLVAIRAAAPAADVMVVDDSSPDGTADLAEEVAAELGQITILRREAKEGLGNAYRHAFAVALQRGYEVLVTLDADFSHDPAVIPQLVECVENGSDVAIGSRYVAGGATPNWPLYRQALSRYGNLYARWLLGLQMRDATAGYRAYRADLLQAVRYETSRANGYTFMTELAYRISQVDAVVSEVPITFADRVRGTSKMSPAIIIEAMGRVTWWGIRLRLRRAVAHPSEVSPAP